MVVIPILTSSVPCPTHEPCPPLFLEPSLAPHLAAQVVATEPLHIMEDVTKPRRGSSTTAWVNIIYGCNEHAPPAWCRAPGA